MNGSKGFTVTVKIPEGLNGNLILERLSLVHLGVFTAYDTLSQPLKDSAEHAEIKLNRHQDEIAVRFIFRGKYRIQTEPWEIAAETRVLFNFTPDITAQKLAERIHSVVKSAISDYRRRVDRLSYELGEFIT